MCGGRRVHGRCVCVCVLRGMDVGIIGGWDGLEEGWARGGEAPLLWPGDSVVQAAGERGGRARRVARPEDILSGSLPLS